MFRKTYRWTAAVGLAAFLASPAEPADAAQTTVAVAANFAPAARDIGARFRKSTGHAAIFVIGSTGQLYAQIARGAPFDIFLAADRDRPRRAVETGFAVAGSRFTYATGRIVLFSRQANRTLGPAILKQGRFARLAIANPVTAPYGAAAVEAMTALGVYRDLTAKLVRGNNIAQTYQFVETGNAELGFVALSQVVGHRDGSRWIVPETLHAPVAQDAVLLKRGAANPAARAFLAFLKSPAARATMARHGYGAGG